MHRHEADVPFDSFGRHEADPFFKPFGTEPIASSHSHFDPYDPSSAIADLPSTPLVRRHLPVNMSTRRDMLHRHRPMSITVPSWFSVTRHHGRRYSGDNFYIMLDEEIYLLVNRSVT